MKGKSLLFWLRNLPLRTLIILLVVESLILISLILVLIWVVFGR